MATWILNLIKALAFLFNFVKPGNAELKRLEKRLQEIKNEMAKTTDSAALNYLDLERLSIVKEIADIHRKRKKGLHITTGR